jgi:hypothetical protein
MPRPSETPTPTSSNFSDLYAIDLTRNSSPPHSPPLSPSMAPRRSRKRRADQLSGSNEASSAQAPATNATPGPSTRSTKRRRTRSIENSRPSTSHSTTSKSGRPRRQAIEIEDVINVDEDNVLNDTLQKQRQEQIASQKAVEGDKPQKLSTLSCTICLENPTDLTATACGKCSSVLRSPTRC